MNEEGNEQNKQSNQGLTNDRRTLNQTITQTPTSPTNELTINDFRFSKIKRYTKFPTINKEQLIVKLVKTDGTFGSLSSQYHRSYIEHNIPEIPNSCPTICQFWEELKVYRCELKDEKTYPMITRKLKQDFFKSANLNFASANNARFHKYYAQLVPYYYYYYNTKTNTPEKLEMSKAKKIFCKVYENDIMNNKKSKTTFMLLLTLCKTRNKEYPVVIRGFENCDNMDGPTNIQKLYEDPKDDFNCEYCLVEMLIHYPKLEECIWNKE